MHEEVFLPLHDGTRHAQDGVKALLHVLDEPTRFLQALLQAGMAFAALVPTQCAGVDVVHAQTGHYLGVELHIELGRAFAGAATGTGHDHVGHDDVALHVHKAPTRARFQPCNQRHGTARAFFARTTGLHQAAHIAPGQQVQRLGADGQRRLHHTGIATAVLLQVAQLQLHAFAQVTRAHAHGLQAVQQAQRHGEAVHQLIQLLHIVSACQPFGQRLQRVFQVAVVVQVFDQKAQHVAVQLRQVQGCGLAQQVIGQRLVAPRQVQRTDFIAVTALRTACRSITAPFAVVMAHVDAAITLPVGAVVF